MDGQALNHITSRNLFKSLDIERAPIVIDVRRKVGFEAADIIIVGATRREPGQVSESLRPAISAVSSSGHHREPFPVQHHGGVAAAAFHHEHGTELTYES